MDILRAIAKKDNQISANNYTFEKLAAQYGDSVYKFCRSLAYSKQDADDLFQETFLKVLEQPQKINDSENPQSFLFSTALFLWKSWKRKYARRNRIASVEPLDESNDKIASQVNVEDDYTMEEEIQIVRKLVDELPEKFKVPVVLYYTMEMDVSEIAATLNIPDGTVKSRLFTARKIIRKGLI